MARKIGILTLLMLATCPSASWALGLGEIDLQSSLNQPMQADIAILGASREELGGLKVQLASADAFRRLGLDRPAYLAGLQFNVMRNQAGQPVLRVSSLQPITEPFVTFLLEARWARGSLLREYTVLLDPPTFVPQASPVPAPQVSPPSTARETTTSGTVLRRPEPAPAAPARPVSEPPAGAPYAAPAGEYRIQRGDTLWAVAERYRPQGVSVNQMMIAMYQANPDAFTGNINRLRAGSILRIPDAGELSSVPMAEADVAVREHMRSWQPGSGMVGERIEPKLQLVPPREAGPGQGSSRSGRDTAEGDEALRQENAQLKRQLDSAEDRLEVQNSQMAALQQQLDDAQRLLEEAGEAPAEPFAEPAEEPAAGAGEQPGEPQAGSQADAGEQQAEPQPAQPEPRPAPAQVVQDQSLLDQLLGWLLSPIAFVALGAIAVLGALLVFLRLRQRGQAEEEPWQPYEEEQSGDELFEELAAATATETLRIQGSADETGSFLVQEQPAADDTANLHTGSFRATATGGDLEAAAAALGREDQELDQVPSIEQMGGQEESDPMAEADFHMAYGLYDQAADILRGALDGDPDNRELQMKLAEVYFVWGNQDEFRAMAVQLAENRSGGDWDKILIMGKQLLPDDPLFSEMPGSAAEDVDLALEATQVGTIVDMELDTGPFDKAGVSSVDLDLGGALDFAGDTRESPAVDADEGTQPGMEALDFELGGDDFGATVETPAVSRRGADREPPTVESPALTAEQTAEIDLDDLGLDVNLDDSFIGRLREEESDESEATGVREAPSFDDDTTDSSLATGVHEAPVIGDEDETLVARLGDSDGSSTAVLERGRGAGGDALDFDVGGSFDDSGVVDEETREMTDTETLNAGDIPPGLETAEMTGMHRISDLDNTAEVPAIAGEDDLDLDLGDLSDVLDDSETQEMRGELGDTMEVLGVGEMDDEDLDLDVGEAFGDDSGGTNTMEMSDMTVPEAEALTLSEIGTKLDLARAYMDMGDPDGARSILQEVVEEGDASQKADARRLLDTLP